MFLSFLKGKWYWGKKSDTWKLGGKNCFWPKTHENLFTNKTTFFFLFVFLTLKMLCSLKVSMEKELIFQLLLPINIWYFDLDKRMGQWWPLSLTEPFFFFSDSGGPLVLFRTGLEVVLSLRFFLLIFYKFGKQSATAIWNWSPLVLSLSLIQIYSEI